VNIFPSPYAAVPPLPLFSLYAAVPPLPLFSQYAAALPPPFLSLLKKHANLTAGVVLKKIIL